jgi:REP element-mobilizing transposase RayT
MNLLANNETHAAFCAYCEQSPEKASIWIGCYVLMPDHLHVFVSAEGSQNLSRWVGSLKKYLSSLWRKEGCEGPFWQEGFFDHLMRNRESYAEKWEYVRKQSGPCTFSRKTGELAL